MAYLTNVRRKWTINILIITLSLTCCLLILEAVLRLFWPFHFMQPIEASEYDEDLGYRFRKAIHSFHLTDYQQEVKTNQLGTLNFQEDLSEYNTIVFALGDSYTQGLGVPADSSYPFQLDLLLNIDNKGVYSKGYGIVNLGLGPYGGKQELITLKRFEKCLRKPNIVLYLGCSNDYTDDLLFDSGIRHKNLVLHNPHYGWFYYPMKWFLLDLEIGKRIKHQVQEGIFKTGAYKAQSEESRGRSIAEMEKASIEKIVTTATELGAVPVVSWFMVGESYDWLKSWAAQNNVRFADWEPTARSITQAVPGIPWENQHSGAHHRTWLNFVIARAFAQEIQTIRDYSERNAN
jgi:hypothetical protein